MRMVDWYAASRSNASRDMAVSKSVRDVTGMAAVFSASPAVKRFSAMDADGVFLHQPRMTVPPFPPAGVGAEFLFAPPRILHHWLTATKALMRSIIQFPSFRLRRLSTTERLDSIHRDFEFFCNRAITHAICPK